MCGISGWISVGGEPPEDALMEGMLCAIRHRGPDERGEFIQGGVGLGMTRLSINDIDGGSQPYYSEDSQVVAVFNGEIYNFKTLREELENKGHRFKSQTDGEVIVHLWEEYGPEFVQQLNGMFAIALWDGRELFLCRDRFGIKPLYYSFVEGVLYFASELKSLILVPGFSRGLNHEALRSYLTMEYVPSPHSIYRQSWKLAPAHFLRVREGRAGEPTRYWTFPRFTADGEGSLQDWAEGLGEGLKQSVQRRLIADVPLGVFLSGGIDSSSITALMSELQPGCVKSFSVAFTEASYDESTHSQKVARFLGTQHFEKVLDPATTLAVIEPLYQSLDEPLGDAALIPTYLLSQFARTEVTVALAGEGADELLGGYPTYLAHQLVQPFNGLPRPVIELIQRMVNLLPTSRKYLSLDFKLKKFCSGLGLPDMERHLTWMGSLPLQGSSDFLLEPHAHAFRWGVEEPLEGLVERIQELDFHSYLSEDLLVKLDRATMLTSLEGRVPFLDHQLVESMARLPTAHKLRGLDAKRVLKKAMEGKLPPEILARPKKGFGIPIADWLRGPLKFLLDEHLNAHYLREQGIFKAEPIEALVKQHLAGFADHRKALWTLLVFQQWWRNFRPSL